MNSLEVSNKQIWPLVVDNNSDNETFWDDKDLIAEYNRIESLVQDKLTSELGKNAKHKSSKISGNFHEHINQDSSSTFNNSKVHHTKDTQEENVVLVNTQSPIDNINPVCDFQWIPPCLNPPPQLFSNLASSRDSHLPSDVRPSPQPVFNNTKGDLSTLEPILRSWYEAGYKLGRSHAMKLKSTSSVPTTNS
ncbi:unnamed protein product [Schistosoma rodhaini]|uniref:Survival motor neuron Tudor domain-containing protein n=1 Tax=Schistosoma rodhaini TaxID=6188 RepID=A0AA85GK14_9TREM|nr:unnamed protein product [Schistosoma rodhaini]CAH8648452.1 unnamed protein product [Schistosoma rodhaini]